MARPGPTRRPDDSPAPGQDNASISIIATSIVLLALAALTVSPVRFLYPNLAPRRWKLPVMLGAAAWLAVLLAMLLVYPRVPAWLVWVSLIYPAFYVTLSILLDPKRRGRVRARSR